MKNLNLKNRILIPFLLLNLILLSLSFLIIFENITIKNQEAFEEKNINITRISTSHLEDKLEALINTQSMVINDTIVFNILSDFDHTLSESKQVELEKQLQKYNLARDIYNIRLFLDTEPHRESSKVFKITQFDEYVMPINKAYPQHMFWVPTYKLKHHLINNTQSVISFVRPIIIQNDFKGYIVVDMLEKNVFDVLANLGSFKHEKPQVVRKDGLIISTYDKFKIASYNENFIRIKNDPNKKIRSRLFRENQQETDTYINHISDSDWYLMIEFDKNEVKKQSTQLKQLMTTLYLFSTIIVILISQKIAAMVTKRINQLNNITNSFINNDFKNYQGIHIDYWDEVGHLQNSINILMKNIETLINERVQGELALKDAELRVLQEQINPHFLYNILDMINWMALDIDAHNISKATSNLAKFFRISLADGSEEITLAQELEHIRLYLEIQNMRYKNAIKYEFDIDENILDYPVPKLILQPIVENSIIHGINEKNQPYGTVKIEAYEDFDYIMIEIKDDGIGMNENLCQSLNKMNHKNGFGIKNIDDRIKLKYGYPFGLTYKSKQNIGTTVSIKLPIIND